MSDELLAACGLDCTVCPAHQAYVHDDPELRRRTAEEWSRAFNAAIRPEDIFCSGCRAEEGPKIGHCNECPVRRCAIDRDLPNCGECGDYPICETIAGYLKMMPPDSRARLDAVHARRAVSH